MKGKLQSKSKAKENLKKPRAQSRAKSRAESPKKKTSSVSKIASAVTSTQSKVTKSKKATAKRAKTNAKPIEKKTGNGPAFNLEKKDVAHSPGHRKMNIQKEFSHKSGMKTEPQNESAMNYMARNDSIKRTTSSQRRVITGAALGKTGRVTIKE